MEGFLPHGVELFPRLERFGRFIGRVLGGPRPLASHGDHFVKAQESSSQEYLADYYDGDLSAVTNYWPTYEAPALGAVEAPNGWGGGREYYEAHRVEE